LRLNAAGTVQSLAVALCSDNERVGLYWLDSLKGVHWDVAILSALLEAGKAVLYPRMKGCSDEEYRCRLVDSLLEQFLASSSALFNNTTPNSQLSVPSLVFSQTFQVPSQETAPVGLPVHNPASLAIVNGTARFCDDEPVLSNLLHCAPVLSTIACGSFVVESDEDVRKFDGVVDVLYAKDVAENFAGPDIGYYLAPDRVHYWGQPIALVVATSQQAALAAVSLLKVSYTSEPAVLTLDDAIASKSEHEWAKDDSIPPHLSHGNVAEAHSVRFFEGSVQIAASEHS
jgi:hypothetical protein